MAYHGSSGCVATSVSVVMAPISTCRRHVDGCLQVANLAQINHRFGPFDAVFEPIEAVHASGQYPPIFSHRSNRVMASSMRAG